jgi:hypothetical protein
MTEFTKADADAWDAAFHERLRRPLPEHVQTDLSLCTAIDSLGVSLKALRMALESANNALGVLGLPDENGRLTEGCEMRSRWCAATQLLTAAITTVETDGSDVIKAVKTLLAVE